MARVPTYDSQQVTASALPASQFGAVTSPTVPNFAAEQAQQAGQAMQQAGAVGGQIALDMQTEANHLRVVDAANQAKEASFDLLYHKETGALNQRGWSALSRESGKDLASEYAERFREVTDKIAAGLGNDAQRKVFAQQAANMRTSLYGQTRSHLSSEFQRYKVSTFDATAATASREIALVGASGKIPVDQETGRSQIDDAADRIIAVTREKARMVGLSQEEADVQAQRVLSGAHVLAIQGAVESGNIQFAAAYVDRYKGQMEAGDLLRVRGVMDKQVQAQRTMAAVDSATKEMRPRFFGSDIDRAFSVAIMAESGGKQFAADGTPLTSKAGAIGIAQVMPATGPEAAKLAGMPWDEHRYRTDESYNRAIGMAYFNEQVRVNSGDLQKAWAAYNAGPGALKEAVKKADKSAKLAQNDPSIAAVPWLQFLPKETREYVTKNSKAYESGAGRAKEPTALEFVQAAVSRLGPDADAEQIRSTRISAEHQYKLITDEKKQRNDDNFLAAQDALVRNGGNFAGLPAFVREAIPADRMDDVLTFAGKLASGVPIETNWNTYSRLVSMATVAPAEFSSTNLMLHRGQLAPPQIKQLIDMQAKVNDPAQRPEVATLAQQLATAHNQLGFKANNHEQKGMFDSAVMAAIADETRTKGRALTFEERDKIIKRMMLPTGGLWLSTDRLYEVAGTAKEKSAVVKMSSDERAMIADSLLRRGEKPTEEKILALFKRRYGIN